MTAAFFVSATRTCRGSTRIEGRTKVNGRWMVAVRYVRMVLTDLDTTEAMTIRSKPGEQLLNTMPLSETNPYPAYKCSLVPAKH